MMRLLKYDWKRNATTLLGALAVLLIVQVLITVTGSIRHWEPGIMMILSMLAYGSASVLLLVVTCKNFASNIKAYHRRLLPVRSVWSIASSLFLACATLLVLSILMLAHAWLYWRMSGLPWEALHLSELPIWYYVANALLAAWQFIFLMITIFFAITVSRSVTKKGSVWIGILVFFVLHYLLGWMNHLLFGTEDLWIGPAATIQFGNETSVNISPGEYVFAWGGLAFELVIAALIVYATAYLIDRKVEV
ncbi:MULTISPECIES: hypothetical protein [Paenibacillus]|uniref:Uncharacterized protein n=2 Tax=Paenibacillus lactis TaxID=228574 RepID=G4HNA6_9BACL|nr:hypothetical protein [Paenibacillus lactis]EHB54268.1 hypothetical protein PaelaDRAFT_5467 [Paenibacillus lactis 154]MBP1896258.1 hypothetical protein [Paenibacillus lactis]MCM3497137.1 hypothetical protein [Paenibacillus lactis]HAF96993.1 hypothetical protein [Paenibacillus lactis]